MSSVTFAAMTCWRLLLGDWDIGKEGTSGWVAMLDIGGADASVFLLSFTFLIYHILLNMLLAVIMDVYTEVRSSIGAHAETLWSEGYEVFMRWRLQRRGEIVTLEHVLKYL